MRPLPAVKSTVVVCCETLRLEMEAARARTGSALPCVWIESGLHNVPDRLRAALKKALGGLGAHTERVLLSMGFCGNAVVGLRTGDYELILPRADDCISILLGSHARRSAVCGEAPTYFLTRGWLDGERNIWAEYQYACKKYGKRRADSLFRTVLAHYERLAVLDTGAYALSALEPETREIADKLQLRHEVLRCDLRYLEALLCGPWPEERFVRVPPHTTIEPAALWLE